jgi:hypothetical protein
MNPRAKFVNCISNVNKGDSNEAYFSVSLARSRFQCNGIEPDKPAQVAEGRLLRGLLWRSLWQDLLPERLRRRLLQGQVNQQPGGPEDSFFGPTAFAASRSRPTPYRRLIEQRGGAPLARFPIPARRMPFAGFESLFN